jgi:hypothetical protein
MRTELSEKAQNGRRTMAETPPPNKLSGPRRLILGNTTEAPSSQAEALETIKLKMLGHSRHSMVASALSLRPQVGEKYRA